MDYLTSIKSYKWIIGGLIVLNIISLSTFWLYRTDEHQKDKNKDFENLTRNKEYRKPDRSGRFLAKELDLNQQQTILFKKERERHFMETSPIKEKIILNKTLLYEAVFTRDIDSERIFTIHQEIIQMENEVERLKLEHFLKLSSYCDSTQKLKLERIFHDIILKERNSPPGRKPNKFKL